MKRKEPEYSNVSAGVVSLLVDRGMTLTQIAKLLGVSKSYISRVGAGNRSFTLDHLIALEQAVGEPLPLLLLQAIPIESVRPELRPLYASTLKAVSGGRPERKSNKRRARAA
jgi:transcriptional regulator with XRE-family HTH domain